MPIDLPRTTRRSRVRTTFVVPILTGALWAFLPASPVSGQGVAAGCPPPHLLGGAPGTVPAAELRVDGTGHLCARSRLPLRDGVRRNGAPDGEGPGAARTFVTSLVVPGGGQWLQGQSRAYLYLGLELVGWGAFVQGRLDGSDLRDRYRDLAWNVARGGDGDPAGEGDFRYYEALADYPSSGAWDLDPAREGLQPETDPETFNGTVWSLAREIYSLAENDGEGDSEARRRALEYYRRNGYPPEMSWSWIGHPDAAERYRRLIEESDDAFRRATIVLGMIAANHVLSAVDGFLSARIAADRTPSAAASLPPWHRTRLSLELRVGGER